MESAVIPTKRCRECREERPLEDYHVSRLNRLGRKTICKECLTRMISARDYSDVPVPALKFCGSCKRLKKGEEFNRHRRQRDGLATQCRECHSATQRKHYERHRDKVLAKTAEWHQKHPDKIYEYAGRHRAKLVGSAGEFAADEWAELKRRHRYRCLRCGAFEGSVWAPQLSPDHIVPLSRGGRNTIDNIQPLCFPCNRWKHNKIIDFRDRRHEMERVWLRPPHGVGEPMEVEATPEILVPLMVKGWNQCAPPAAAKQEVTENVGH